MRARAAGAVAVAGLSLLSAAPSAQARLSCSFSGPPQNLLTVKASGTATIAVVRRSGDRIVVRQYLGRSRPCAGDEPTVLNTDSIRVLLRRDALAELRLDNGPFAPGATPEAEGDSEIEVEFLGGFAVVQIVGTRGADEFRWGPAGAHDGLNLNPGSAGDRDVDVTVKGIYSFLVASGRGGNDTIVPAPGFGGSRSDGAYSEGGRGNDLLVAPSSSGGVLDGGPGDDKLTGGRRRDYILGGTGRDDIRAGGGPDFIRGGLGADLIFGGPGPDRVNAKDVHRDVVKCSLGRDQVRANRQDRLRGCESVRY